MPQHEAMPDSHGKSIQTARSLSQQEMDAGISPSRCDPIHLLQLEKNPKVSLTMRKEP